MLKGSIREMSTAKVKFDFNQTKAIETIIYIASKVSNASHLRISKLLYFADKTSLEKYGRLISGDTWVAMERGPVPSHTYDLLKAASSSKDLGFESDRAGRIVACRPPNLDEFSDSDIECLDLTIKIWGDSPVWKLIQDSHDDIWTEVWARRGSKGSIEIPLEGIIDLLEDSDELLEYLRTQHDD